MPRFPNIEAERARNGYDVSDIAEVLKVSSQTYYNWQAERSDIPASKLAALADLFGVSTDYLLGRVKEAR